MKDKQFESEQQFVIDTFQKSFDKLKKKKIVLYGVGKNTEAVLYGTNGFSFMGLMDQATIGKTIFGYKVLSEDEVIALHPIIVIIARESVVNIIFKRIQHLQTEHGIEIYDFQGHLLGQENLIYNNQNLPYWNVSEQDLWEQIIKHDVISFDIFDTLLMRRGILYPEDVFLLAELRLKAEGLEYPFAKMRKEAEVTLMGYPDLDEIYENLQKLSGWTNVVINRMKQVECETDDSLLLRREVMCRIFQRAIEQGKKVYLISDMYYPKVYLEKLLCQNGIVGYQELFVSCDIKKEKSDGSLFQWYLEQVKEGSKLHIGDNRRADVQKALENGIGAYQVYSAYEMLMASSMQEILSNVKTLQQRCILGLIVSRIFNSPFSLYSSKGYIEIRDMGDLGYCFIAPMFMEFIKWFLVQVKENHIEQILFPSRDGYLMQKIYEIMTEDLVESIYFRASRRAVSVAAIKNKSDIERIASKKYQGTCRAFLKLRFGIEMKTGDERKNILLKDLTQDEIYQVLCDYEDVIIENAKTEKMCYLKYLNQKGIQPKKNLALFDFVAGGTVQYYLRKILECNIMGIYFATIGLPNGLHKVNTPDIKTAYGNVHFYSTKSYIGKYYEFLETILIDNKESFSHIDSYGREVFEINSAKSDYSEIEKVQSGILEYVADYKKYFNFISMNQQELDFTDNLFGIIFSKQCVVDSNIKKVFQNDDVYNGVDCCWVWNE